MQTEVVKVLSSFLGALPYQVQTWDSAVVEYLANSPRAFEAFVQGNEQARWDIYSKVRSLPQYQSIITP
jgi:hypothetical protein